MASVDASGDRDQSLKAVEHLGNLLEASAQRKFSSGGVFDEDGETTLGEVEARRSGVDRRRRSPQSLFAIGAAKRSRMQHQVIGAECERPVDLAAKSFNRFLEKQRSRAGEVHQVVGVDDQRLQIVFLTQAEHVIALRASEIIGSPLAGTRRENLQRVASQTPGPFSGVMHSSRTRSMDADAPGSKFR